MLGPSRSPVLLTDNTLCGHATFESGNKGTLDWQIVAVGCATKAKRCKTPAVLAEGSKDWTLGPDGYIDIDLPNPDASLLAQVSNKCCLGLMAVLTATDSKAVDELFFSCNTASDEFFGTVGGAR